jgi:hypothetical protein
MAYQTKQWAMGNIATVLSGHAEALGISWGWRQDPTQEYHDQVLYVDLPTGQVSFHTSARGVGPDYSGQWDRATGAGPGRVIRYAASVLAGPTAAGVQQPNDRTAA